MKTTKELKQHVRFISFFGGAVCLMSVGCVGEDHLITDDVVAPDASPAGDVLTPKADAEGAGGSASAVPPQGTGGAVGTGETVTSLGDKESGGWPIALTTDEVARRLALFLYKTPPSARLIQEVAARNPRTNEDVGALTDALLFDEQSSQGVRGFYRWWLRLDNWNTRTVDPKTFPLLTPDARQSLLEDALTFGELATWEAPGTFAALMTEPAAYVTASTPDGWFPQGTLPANRSNQYTKVNLPASLYAGILSQPAVVSARDSVSRSPTRRGMTVLESVLCNIVPPPPADLPAVPAPEGTTLRQRLESATAGEACKACHQLLDPLGFMFENFNAVGAFTLTDGNMPVDSFAVVGSPLFSTPQKLRGAPDLANSLATSATAWNCFAANWLAYATGVYKSGNEVLENKDESGISYIVRRATVKGQLNLRGVIRAVTETRAFLKP